MKSKEKITAIALSGTLLIMLLMPTKAHAALQANGSGATTKDINTWMSEVRKMEAQGGTLGLTGSSSLTQVAGADGKVADSNNLDIHMEKNTEYGAMAILSASSYGKSTPVHETTDGSLSTTTGNKSGVYITLNKEWVSAGNADLNVANFQSAVGKYKNIYTGENEAKAGDAITETKQWHTTAGASVWFGNIRGANYSGLLRAYSGSLFSYYGYGYNEFNYSNLDASSMNPWYSRAVVVLGSGF